MAIKPFGSGSNSGGGGGGGGAAPTLSNITGGPLRTSKGGTGINATNISELRNKLGIGAHLYDAASLLYCKDTIHQQVNTIQRVDASTANAPTGAGDGFISKVGDDQFILGLSDGKEWRRAHSDTRGDWSSIATVNPANIDTLDKAKAMAAGSIGYTTTDSLLPQFTDNSKPVKVVISRNGDYLIAANRFNMWFANLPSDSADTSISWKWEGNNKIPANLRYTGGEHDEELIPAGESAILAGKTGIDGEEYITLLVTHAYDEDAGTSTYFGYFLDSDNTTIKRSRNRRSYSAIGEWERTQLDVDGIDDTIISKDRQSSDPVFHGIVPEISSMKFPDYTVVASSSGMSAGDVFYNDTGRTLYVVHQALDTHLSDLFNADFEVEIHKDSSSYVRGVFDSSVGGVGSGISAGLFREEDLTKVGTISSGDTVEIRGHKSVVTKTDRILPVNLGLSHGSSEANKLVSMNASGNSFALTTSTGALKKLIIMKQTTDMTVGNTASFQVLNTQTPAWIMANRSTDYILFNGNGLAYCSAGTPAAISVQVQLLYRHATTESGLTSASWTVVNLGTGDDAFFRSKLYAGSDDLDIQHRDYHWATGDRIIPLSDLNGVNDGNYIQFTVQIRKENLDYSTISAARNTFLTCKVYNGSIVSST